MDLGLAGKRALICASSGGLGFASAIALAREGADVVVNGRDVGRLELAMEQLRAVSGADVRGVVADVTTAEGIHALTSALPDPDIVVTNNAGPPPADFDDLDHASWLGAVQANMLAQIDLVRAVLPPMRARRFGRVVNITSAMVTNPDPRMTLSAGARAGLTAVMKGLSKAVAKDGVTINNLLPERFDTPRQEYMAHRIAEERGITYAEARRRQIDMMVAGRLGRPEEFGATCAFLCSVDAGFITGQNLHLDGGNYPALV